MGRAGLGRVSCTQAAMVYIYRLLGGIFFLRVIKLKCLQSFQTNVCKSVGKRKYVIGFLKSVQVFVGLLGKVVHEDSLAIFCFFPPLQRSQGLQLLVVALSE